MNTQPIQRIICLGNELIRDDGIGIRVGRVLETLDLPDHVVIEVRRMVGFEFLDDLEPGEELILVDASWTGDKPGTIKTIELDDVGNLTVTPSCCHEVGLAEILEIAKRVCPDRLPSKAVIIGIEAEELKEFGLSMTSKLIEALPDAVVAVLKAIGATEKLIEEGRKRAIEWKSWKPDVIDDIVTGTLTESTVLRDRK